MIALWLALVLAAPPPPQAPSSTVSDSRAAFYRRAFPSADRFVLNHVPADALPPPDRGNETYVEARGANDELLGYLRDFAGPVTASPVCPCSPLNLTLVLGPDLRFVTLLTEAPLEKLGHVPMTAEETERLIQLVREPPEALTKAPRPDDLVDATTGATRTEYRDVVVPQAALTTRRLVGLVEDTARLVRGAPLSRDQELLRDGLKDVRDSLVASRRLEELLPRLESEDARRQAFGTMAYHYAEALRLGAPRQDAVEKRLLAARDDRPQDLAAACQQLADRGVGLPFVDECLSRLASRAADVPAAAWALLQGTAAFEAGRIADAVGPLQAAAEAIEPSVNPALHLRLVQALSAIGEKAEGCRRVQPLYRDMPLYPGADTWLSLCPGSEDALVAKLREERKKALLAGERHDKKLPPLSLVNDEGSKVTLDVEKTGRAHVLIFFAAWCPHCQADFPAFRDVASAIGADPALRERVRVLGIRTYLEQDTEPWSDFAQRFVPNFTVWADPEQGSALRKAAGAFGLTTSVPRLLVVDAHGVLRFVVEAGDYRDIASELRWAAEATVSSP
jgi:peroxiredoxin